MNDGVLMVSIVSLDPPLVGIRLKERQTSVYIRDIYKGLGTLYITEEYVSTKLNVSINNFCCNLFLIYLILVTSLGSMTTMKGSY